MRAAPLDGVADEHDAEDSTDVALDDADTGSAEVDPEMARWLPTPGDPAGGSVEQSSTVVGEPDAAAEKPSLATMHEELAQLSTASPAEQAIDAVDDWIRLMKCILSGLQRPPSMAECAALAVSTMTAAVGRGIQRTSAQVAVSAPRAPRLTDARDALISRQCPLVSLPNVSLACFVYRTSPAPWPWSA